MGQIVEREVHDQLPIRAFVGEGCVREIGGVADVAEHDGDISAKAIPDERVRALQLVGGKPKRAQHELTDEGAAHRRVVDPVGGRQDRVGVHAQKGVWPRSGYWDRSPG